MTSWHYCSVALHGALPSLEKPVIIRLLSTDAPLVLNLGQLSSTFFIHAILEVTAHCAVALTNLTENIGLVGLALVGVLECTLLVHLVEAVHLIVNHLLIVLLEPFSLLLQGLLEKDVLLTVLIHVLHQVNTSLILTTPLGLPSIPLPLIFNLSQLVNLLLARSLVRFHVLVMGLESANFLATGVPLVGFPLLDSLLLVESILKENLVTVALSLLSLLTQLLLGSVVSDELEVALTVQHESLLSVLLLLLLFDSPLLTKHGLFGLDKFLLLLALDITGLLLPVKNSHRVLNLFLLLTSLLHLTLEFLLGIELPELGVHLLLHHFLLNVPPLVDKLLFTLNGRTIVVELLILTPESIVLTLELHVLAAGDLLATLLLTLGLQGLKTLEHLLTDLLRRFKVVVKFLLVDAILSGKQLSQFGFPLFKVGGFTAAHVFDAVANYVLLNHFIRFRLPVRLVGQVVVATNVVHHLCVFLETKERSGALGDRSEVDKNGRQHIVSSFRKKITYELVFTAGHDVCITAELLCGLFSERTNS